MQDDMSSSSKVTDDELVAATVKLVSDMDGVSRLAGGITDNLSENILGITSSRKGVKLSRKDEGILIDVYLNVLYRVKIPQLAWDIQSHIKEELEKITDEEVIEVNIHVQGVDPAKEEQQID